jgi:hypothetical protein
VSEMDPCAAHIVKGRSSDEVVMGCVIWNCYPLKPLGPGSVRPGARADLKVH